MFIKKKNEYCLRILCWTTGNRVKEVESHWSMLKVDLFSKLKNKTKLQYWICFIKNLDPRLNLNLWSILSVNSVTKHCSREFIAVQAELHCLHSSYRSSARSSEQKHYMTRHHRRGRVSNSYTSLNRAKLNAVLKWTLIRSKELNDAYDYFIQ